jgi:iron complex outermembrane receptor protein
MTTHNTNRPVRNRCAAAVTTALLFSQAATSATLEEVVVTATKRSESLQEVPIAVAAFTATQIKELGVSDLRQMTAHIAGVELFDDRGSSSQPTWIIRGVGLADFNANNTPTAAIYYDEFYLTSNVMGGIGMFDIERIEVLKGAQGGLYGRNTTGGAVRVNSTQPSLEEGNGYIKGSYGRWDQYNIEGAVGLPLTDNLAIRIAGMTDQGGGWQDSLATPGDDEWGDRDFTAVRAQLLYQPTDALSISLKIDTGQDKSETPLGHGIGAYDPNTGLNCSAVLEGRQDNESCIHWSTLTNLVTGAPVGPLASEQSGDGETVLANPVNEMDNDWFLASARIDLDMDFATLTSITGYIDYENKQLFDYEGGQLVTGHERNDSPIESWSQEFRLVSNDNGEPLEWLVGGLYAEDELNEFRTFLFPDNILIFEGLPDSDRGFDQETTSWAVYGQLGYQLTEAWKVHGSLRYSDEDKKFRDGYSTLNIEPGVPLQYFVQDANQDWELDEQWSGHVGVDWTPTDNAMVYAKYTRGFKSGGFFGGFFLSEPETAPYDEEIVDSFELGFKSDWADSTLRVNGAVYYYDYSDVQGFTSVFSEVTQTALTKLDNLGDAEHKGAELELTWLPPALEGLMLAANFAWLDTELDSDFTFLAQDFETVVPYDGLQRGYAPEFSYYLQGRYERNLFENLLGVVELNYSWRDDQVNLDTTGTPIDTALAGIEDYGVLNGRIQLGSDNGQWHVALIGKNLTDEEYKANTTFDNLGGYLSTYGRPRSWMVEVNYGW